MSSLGEEVFGELGVDLVVVAAEPFEDHGGVLQLLAGVVAQDRLERGVVAVVRPLAVPVDRLELLDQRGDRVVPIEGLAFQLFTRDMKAFAGHGTSFLCAILRTNT